MDKFRTESGTLVYDVRQFILDTLEKNPDATIHIGTDAQRVKKGRGGFNFATVIAIRYSSRGVHFIFSPLREKGFKTIEQRLMFEVELTARLALWFQEFAPDINIDFYEADINSDDEWLSNKVYNAARGWLVGIAPQGTKVLTKPDELVAVRAANHLV